MSESTAPLPEGDSTAGSDSADLLAEHPEIYVGGAFAGGLALALALRLLGR